MNIKKIAAAAVVILACIGAGVGTYRIHVLDQNLGIGKGRWLVCSHLHRAALYVRAKSYRDATGHWPANVKELVEAHYLPEYSEVHLCPSQVDPNTPHNYDGYSFVEKNETGPVGFYASSPYRFQVVGDNFEVICTLDPTHNH